MAVSAAYPMNPANTIESLEKDYSGSTAFVGPHSAGFVHFHLSISLNCAHQAAAFTLSAVCDKFTCRITIWNGPRQGNGNFYPVYGLAYPPPGGFRPAPRPLPRVEAIGGGMDPEGGELYMSPLSCSRQIDTQADSHIQHKDTDRGFRCLAKLNNMIDTTAAKHWGMYHTQTQAHPQHLTPGLRPGQVREES